MPKPEQGSPADGAGALVGVLVGALVGALVGVLVGVLVEAFSGAAEAGAVLVGMVEGRGVEGPSPGIGAARPHPESISASSGRM